MAKITRRETEDEKLIVMVNEKHNNTRRERDRVVGAFAEPGKIKIGRETSKQEWQRE